MASDSSIGAVWIRSASLPEVLIDYTSGIRFTARPEDYSGTPEDYYKAQIADGIPGEITSIDNITAFVVPQDTQGDLGSVTMVINGLTISIIGHGDFTTDQLIAAAKSVAESPSSG